MLQSKLSLTKPRIFLRSVPRMDKLQATSQLLVVWGQSPAQGLSRERELFFNTDKVLEAVFFNFTQNLITGLYSVLKPSTRRKTNFIKTTVILICINQTS
jgi:hypothetical protein